MFDLLISKFTSQSHKMNSIPDGHRVYAIGDIHGCATLLDQLLDKIYGDIYDSNLEMSDVTVIFLGDYIDRGSDTPQVLDRLISLQSEEFTTVFLKGNHEASLLKFLSDPATHISWLDWGGEETLRSYDQKSISAREPHDLAAGLKNAMPPMHLTFLKSLQNSYEFGGFLFVHAGIKPGVPMEEQSEHDLLWIRDEFHKSPKMLRPAQTVIHGHASSSKVVDKGWRVCLDTGAVWTGVLTAIVLENRSKRFLTTEEKRKSSS